MSKQTAKSEAINAVAVPAEAGLDTGKPSVHSEPTTRRVTILHLVGQGSFGPNVMSVHRISSTIKCISIQPMERFGVSGFSVLNSSNESVYFVPMTSIVSVEEINQALPQ